MPREITVYSAKLCGDCQLLKRFMDESGIEYKTRDIHEDPGSAEELEMHTGKLGVPYVRIDDEWKRGYDLEKPFSDEFARSLFGLDEEGSES